MTKSLMISIHKKHVDNIKNKLKKLELRTWLPKLNGLKGIWVYIYETLNNGGIGGVIGRFWFDEYEELFFVDSEDDYKLTYDFGIYYDYDDEIFNKLCLTKSQVNIYGKGKDLYAWHIKKLEVFDTPKSLSEFYKAPHFKLNNFTTESIDGFDEWLRLKKAPQKFCYCYVVKG